MESKPNPNVVPAAAAAPAAGKMHIKYDAFSAHYANQAIIVTAAEEVYFDFSSGIVTDPASGQSLLPIHTRIAMTHGAARRFQQALEQALRRLPASTPATSPRAAALPKLDS